jgi:hypothetical protein
MVLKHQRCKNIQNLKPTNNSTFQQNLINSRYTHTSNVTSNGTCNNNSNNSEWDCSNNSRSLNSNNSTPLLIYHQNIRGLQNKIDELSILWSTNFSHILCFTEHHLRSEEINCTYINLLKPSGNFTYHQV